ncbi:type III secretion protein [Thalassospira sp. MA62]|nr:type III secretion protein [Thalassospira sp. MA62]
MANIFAELLVIKERREQGAEGRLALSRMEAQQAADTVAEREQKLVDYRDWMRTHQDHLFDEICEKTVKVREIEDLRTRILMLRDEEQAIETSIDDARKAHQQALEAVRLAEQRLKEATRQREKFDDLAQSYDAELREALAYKEEMEMEEFTTPVMIESWEEEQHGW